MTEPEPPDPFDFDFDPAYRRTDPHIGVGNPPPWSLGEPQPELAALVSKGKIRGTVLDVGCGEAALALRLAELGHPTVGLDASPTAIELARTEAARRGLTNVTFAVADVTSFDDYPAGSEGRFDTVVDSGLFHSMPVDRRDDYQRAIARAAAPRARYFVLVFDAMGLPDNPACPVTRKELRQAVSPYWRIRRIKHARVYHAGNFDPEFPTIDLRDEDDGRKSLPGFLLSARRR